MKPADTKLAAMHTPHAIGERLDAPKKHDYVADAVLGGIDGCITTFAIVASAVGAGLPHAVAVVMGLANLAADGFSMAVSNSQAAKSRRERVAGIRREEERHIDLFPEGEREEIRQIFARKGFEGKILDDIVEVITSDRKIWVDTMIVDEHGLELEAADPLTAGLTTFFSFVLVGFLPLVPFFLPLAASAVFPTSCGIAALVFFAIGAGKGMVHRQPVFKAGVNTLLTGGAAAVIAFLIGDQAQHWLAQGFGG